MKRVTRELMAYIFSLKPWMSLLAFIIVPAHKRVVFEESMGLVWTIFYGAFMSVAFPWALEVVRNSNISINDTTLDSANLEL